MPPDRAEADGPRVGLVLGAGGVLGSAWLIGALTAIASESGWDPGAADHIVGTSAGSMIGALLACGVPPWLMLDDTAGDENEDEDEAGTRSPGGIYQIDPRGLALGPGSWRLATASLTRPRRFSPMAVMSGWLPRGVISTEPLKHTVRRACTGSWAPHPNYWAMAVDYATGQRTALGRSGSPAAQLPDAVAASCAIPGFYRPVEIDSRQYIDGGVYSTSNLDVLRHEPLDLVLALNPMSSLQEGSSRTVAGRLAVRMRHAAGRRLGAEAKKLRAAGIEVLLIQPTETDLEVMGPNLMSGRRRREVTHTAVATVTEQLRGSPLGDRLAELPSGHPWLVRRPDGPASAWPDFAQLARERWDVAAAA